jgi:hypothetical protein
MTMTEQQSIQWQSDSAGTYIAALRASLGDSVNEATLEAMEMLYRAGWNDCYRLAKLNGAIKYYKGLCADTGKEIWQ